MDQAALTEDYRREFRKIEVKKARAGFWSHLLVFSLVNLIIIIYNVVGNQTWFWYPLILWTVILLVHFFRSVIMIGNTTRKKEKLALEKLIILESNTSNTSTTTS